MLLNTATDIQFGNAPAIEAWNGGKRVWSRYEYNWIPANAPSFFWTDIAFGNNTFVVVGNNAYSYSLNNGVNWSPAIDLKPLTSPESYSAVVYGQGKWISIESLAYEPWGSKNFYTTYNVTTGWNMSTLQHPFTGWQWMDLIYSSYHNKFIAVGSPAIIIPTSISLLQRDSSLIGLSSIVSMHSTDGINWLSGSFISDPNPQIGYNHIVEGLNMPNHRLVACGGGGNTKFGYSDDGGEKWSQAIYNPSTDGKNLQVGFAWSQVAYGYDTPYLPLSGRYVSVAAGSPSLSGNKRAAYSDDGINWKLANDVERNAWNTVTFANGQFVAIAGYSASNQTGNLVMTSKDGINWAFSTATSDTTNIWYDLTFGNNRFVACSTSGNNRVMYSNFINI